jgi:hypothetical protein
MPKNDRSDVMTVLSLLGSCAFMKDTCQPRGTVRKKMDFTPRKEFE